MSAQTVPFAKMNGLGNEIIVADMRGRGDRVAGEAALALARDPATAFDQIMAIHDPLSAETDAYIHILNSDGSRAGACGNGMRCVVSALVAETGRNSFTFQTISGVLPAFEGDNGLISVDMGKPRFQWQQIPLAEEFHDTSRIELQVGPIDAPILHSPSVANMGNPHAVFWVDGDVMSYDLEKFGPLLERHPIFPEGANISIARVSGRDAITLRTWERGAGLTQACGSAACAATVCGARTARTERMVQVTVPGGVLDVQWSEDDHVWLTGPAQYEFSGMLDPATGAWVRAVEGAA